MQSYVDDRSSPASSLALEKCRTTIRAWHEESVEVGGIIVDLGRLTLTIGAGAFLRQHVVIAVDAVPRDAAQAGGVDISPFGVPLGVLLVHHAHGVEGVSNLSMERRGWPEEHGQTQPPPIGARVHVSANLVLQGKAGCGSNTCTKLAAWQMAKTFKPAYP